MHTHRGVKRFCVLAILFHTHGHILNILDLFSNGHTYLNILNRLAIFPFLWKMFIFQNKIPTLLFKNQF